MCRVYVRVYQIYMCVCCVYVCECRVCVSRESVRVRVAGKCACACCGKVCVCACCGKVCVCVLRESVYAAHCNTLQHTYRILDVYRTFNVLPTLDEY